MKPRNEGYINKTKALFEDANFIKDIGIKPLRILAGYCETELDILPKHLQQHNFIHAGVQTSMADHTAGAAATTLINANEEILTIEFKINFLRPAKGSKLICKSKAIKSGKTIFVVESEVFSIDKEVEKLTAKAFVTLMPVVM